MAYDLSQITSGKCIRAPRIILLGVEKIGKSTFAAEANNPVFLPIAGEEGIDDLDVHKVPVCQSVGDVLGWLQFLYESQHEFQTVAIDSVSTLALMMHAEICQQGGVKSINDVGGGFGKGTDEALSRWQDITAWLDALRRDRNMTSILVGHVKIRRFDDPGGDSYDQYQMDVHEKVSNLLFRWADSILFCNNKVAVKEEKLGFHKENVKKRGIEINPGSRWLYTQKRPAHPGGGRGVYGELEYELPLSWEACTGAVVSAMRRRGNSG